MFSELKTTRTFRLINGQILCINDVSAISPIVLREHEEAPPRVRVWLTSGTDIILDGDIDTIWNQLIKEKT
jgi:hypothetical protein